MARHSKKRGQGQQPEDGQGKSPTPLSISPMALDRGEQSDPELIRSPFLKGNPKKYQAAKAAASGPIEQGPRARFDENSDGLTQQPQSIFPHSIVGDSDMRPWQLRPTQSPWGTWQRWFAILVLLLVGVVGYFYVEYPREFSRTADQLEKKYYETTKGVVFLRPKDHAQKMIEIRQKDTPTDLIPGSSAAALIPWSAMDCPFLFIEAQARRKAGPLTGEGRLALANCYLLQDDHQKALESLSDLANPLKKSNWSKGAMDEFALHHYLKSGHRVQPSWLSSALKSCQADRKTQYCALYLLASHDTPTRRMIARDFGGLMASTRSWGPLTQGVLWLIGGKLALGEGRFKLAQERVQHALKVLPKEWTGLRKEAYELGMIVAYWSGTGKAAQRILRAAQAELSPVRSQATRQLELVKAAKAKEPYAKLMSRFRKGESRQFRDTERFMFEIFAHEGIRQGDTKEVLRQIRATEKSGMLQSNEQIALAKIWKIRSLLAAGDTQKTYKELAEIEKLQGPTRLSHHLRGITLMNASPTKQYQLMAVKEFQKALKLEPTWETHYALGVALIRGGKIKLAEPVVESLESFRSVKSAKPWIALLKIELMIARGKTKQAVPLLDQFLTKRPQSLAALQLKAKALEQTGKRDLYLQETATMSRLGAGKVVWALPEMKGYPLSPLAFLP